MGTHSTPSEVGWDENRKVRRRSFLLGSAAAVGLGAVSTGAVAYGTRDKPRPEAHLRPISMAMHVHACASEGPGSMEAQLNQAAATGVNVLWWTEHDFRMSAHDAVQRIRFDAATENTDDAVGWRWTSIHSAGATPLADYVTAASHPQVGDRERALLLGVTASGGAARHTLSGQSGNLLNRTSLSGQTIQVDVFPTEVTSSAILDIQLTTSYRPSRTTAPAGNYVLNYRIGGGRQPGLPILTSPTEAVITLDAPLGRWTTVSFTPEADLARLWSGVQGADASLFEMALVATARGRKKKATGYFANLRFSRDTGGQLPLAVQRRLMTFYEDKFPTVKQIQALEVSLTTPHLGWYGGHIALPDYAGAGPNPSQDQDVALTAVRSIHHHGGLVSYCHPFGTAVGELSASEQETARVTKVAEMVTNRALGCDLLEVGYRLRGGCTLPQHESVWDNCSRNEIFLTGVGVNDDHKGENWSGELLNFVTWAWAPNRDTSSLLAALASGHVYFGDLARFRGQLDLRLGDRSAMGRVSVSGKSTRQLTILASGLPPSAKVEVWRVPVDNAGASDSNPKRSSTTFDAAEFGVDGLKTMDVDTSSACFVRVVVKDDTDVPIGFSNPVWLLRATPRHGIPDARKLAS